MTRARAGIVAGALVAALSVYLWRQYGSEADLSAIRANAERLSAMHTALAVGRYFLVYVLISFAAFFPAAIALNLIAGAVFGWAAGSVLVAAASAVAGGLVFGIVRFAFRPAFLARYGRQAESFNRALERDGALFVWMVRVTPIFPFALVNIVMALTPVPLLTFLAVSFLGMLPASAAYAFIGVHLAQMRTLRDLFDWQVTLAFVVLGVLPLATKSWLVHRTGK